MVLFHATFKVRLPSIKQHGLGSKQFKNWDISRDGSVYFALDPDVAESYCEVAEDVENYVYHSGIVVLCVDIKDLDLDKLGEDENQIGDNGTVAYKGVVPSHVIKVWERGKTTPL